MYANQNKINKIVLHSEMCHAGGNGSYLHGCLSDLLPCNLIAYDTNQVTNVVGFVRKVAELR
jgi:hypothetical protein